MLVTTKVAISVVVVRLVETVIVDVASGTKKVVVAVAGMIEVWVMVVVLADKVVNVVEMQLVRVMVLVVTDSIYSTQSTAVGYALFFLRGTRLTFFGTYPIS